MAFYHLDDEQENSGQINAFAHEDWGDLGSVVKKWKASDRNKPKSKKIKKHVKIKR